MKKSKGIFLAAAFCIAVTSLVGCSKKEEEIQEISTETMHQTTASTTEAAETTTPLVTMEEVSIPDIYPEEIQRELMENSKPEPEESSNPVEFHWNSFDPNEIDGIVGYYAKDLTIPYNCNKVGNNAFQNNATIQKLTFENPYTEIGSFAFDNCSSIETVELPLNLETISECAFQSCVKLQSIRIPETVKEIQTKAFFDCTSLLSVELKEGLEKIGDTAFYGCSNLWSIYIPEGVKEIGDYAFGNCANLGSVHFPATIEYCGLYPISGDANVPTDQQKKVKVFVKEGSYMDVNFDMIFKGTMCEKYCY